LIFFVYRFWDGLKRYRIVRASLEGITAASSGMVVAAAVVLFLPLEHNVVNPAIVVATFAILQFTKVPAPLLIIGGIVLGALIP
jgi:chromate transporter